MTAENRPACASSQYAYTWVIRRTHEYQRRVHILVAPPHGFLAVFLGHLAVIFVELGANDLGGQVSALSPTVKKVPVMFRRDAERVPTHPPVPRFLWPPLVLPRDRGCGQVLAKRVVTDEI